MRTSNSFELCLSPPHFPHLLSVTVFISFLYSLTVFLDVGQSNLNIILFPPPNTKGKYFNTCLLFTDMY